MNTKANTHESEDQELSRNRISISSDNSGNEEVALQATVERKPDVPQSEGDIPASKCSGEKTWISGPCAVCSLLDNDKSKKKVAWCNFCQVHICESCYSDWGKRVVAFMKKYVRKVLG